MVDVSVTQPVFISYSRADQAFISRLIDDLQARGVRVWIDQSGLEPGTPDWEDALREAIRASRALLLIASPNSRKSRYVKDEIRIAEMYQRPVYPVWASGEQWMESIPMGWGGTQAIDAREARYADALTRIVQTLSNIAPAASKPIAPAPIAQDWIPRNPYKGLRAFQDSDSGDFFGRNRLIDTLLEALAAQKGNTPRFLAVVGSSGSGKSSVVMAGLLPRLLRETSGYLYLGRMVPDVHPLESLTEILKESFPAEGLRTIRDDLDDSARGLHLRTRLLTRQTGGKAILFIDQFEEVFTQTALEAERQQFIDLLVTAATEPEGSTVVIITLRADFYDRPMNYPELWQLIEAYSKFVVPMDVEELRAAIEKPTALPDVQIQFEGDLVGDLLFEVRGEAGALPLLQFTLDQLFQRRSGHLLTYAAYREIGGVRGALAKHAEETYAALPSDEHRRLTRALFLRLIEPGATEQDTTRRRAALSELTLPDPTQSKIIRECADRFVAARLLTTDQIADTVTIEVSHEALIREWALLAEWLHDARNDIMIQQNVSEDAAAWVARGRKPHDDGLYRGAVLEEKQAWAARNVPSADEMAFIETSATAEAERRRQDAIIARRVQNLGRATILAALVGVVVVVLLGFSINHTFIEADLLTKAAVILAQGNAQMDKLERTLTPVPLTLTPVQQTLQAAQINAANVNATLTPIPVTLTAIAQQIAAGNAQIESLRLAAQANTLLTDPSGNTDAAALLAIRALKTSYTAQADAALVQALNSSTTRQIFRGHTDAAVSVVFSPDGKQVLTGSRDNTAQLWDAMTGQSLRTFTGHTGWVSSAAFSPDGKQVLTASFDKTARLWDITNGQVLRTFSGHQQAVQSAVFSPDGKTILTASDDTTARLWDVASGQVLQTFSGHQSTVESATFSPDGKTILTASDDQTVRLWDVVSGEMLHIFSGHADKVYSAVFSPDGKTILTASADHTVRRWDVASGQVLHIFSGHTDVVLKAVFSPDGTTILSGSWDDTARLWNVATGQTLRILSGHTGWVYDVAFSPDGKQILTASDDKTTRLWNANGGNLPPSFSGHTKPIMSAVISPDGKHVLTASSDNTARLWDISSGQVLRIFAGHTDIVYSAAFSPDGKTIVTASADETARLWDIATGQTVQTFSGQTNAVVGAVFSPDGKTALTANADGTAQLWDIATGKALQTFTGHEDAVNSAAFSPDGKEIITASSDDTARLWDVATGKMLYTFDQTNNVTSVSSIPIVTSASFSPDGKTILISNRDGTVQLWDVNSKDILQTFSGHTDAVVDAIFSPDGKTILTTSEDQTVRLWDIASGQTLRIFSEQTNDSVPRAAFSPDGKQILTTGKDNSAHLWDASYHDFIAYACAHVFRDFTDNERQQFGINDGEPTCPQFATTDFPLTTPMPPTTTPIPNLTIPAWTPIASPTLAPTVTPAPTLTPTATATYPGVLLTFTASPTITPSEAATTNP
ncbi:MAG: TIR domain-containing protein [Chloroflexota bacterium]